MRGFLQDQLPSQIDYPYMHYFALPANTVAITKQQKASSVLLHKNLNDITFISVSIFSDLITPNHIKKCQMVLQILTGAIFSIISLKYVLIRVENEFC